MRVDVDVGRAPNRERRKASLALADDALHLHTGRTGRQGKDFALRIPFEAITKLACDEAAGLLTVESSEAEPLVLHLGRNAPEWKRIMEERPDPLAALGVSSGARVGVVGIQEDDEIWTYLASHVRNFAGENRETPDLDFLFVGAEHRADLKSLRAHAERVRKPGGILWVVAGPRVDMRQIAAACRDAGLALGDIVAITRTREARRLTRV
jgi:hypothetical protein